MSSDFAGKSVRTGETLFAEPEQAGQRSVSSRLIDLAQATQVLEATGFVDRHAAHITIFLDGPNAGARDAVHVIFAGEKVRKADAYAAPEINDATLIESDRTIPLKSLVTMKLTSFRRKDHVHLLDMISIGLIDATWCSQLPEELSQRLQQLLDDPDG